MDAVLPFDKSAIAVAIVVHDHTRTWMATGSKKDVWLQPTEAEMEAVLIRGGHGPGSGWGLGL